MSSAGSLRVVVGEDSYLVREGIVRALEESGRAEVVARLPATTTRSTRRSSRRGLTSS